MRMVRPKYKSSDESDEDYKASEDEEFDGSDDEYALTLLGDESEEIFDLLDQEGEIVKKKVKKVGKRAVSEEISEEDEKKVKRIGGARGRKGRKKFGVVKAKKKRVLYSDEDEEDEDYEEIKKVVKVQKKRRVLYSDDDYDVTDNEEKVNLVRKPRGKKRVYEDDEDYIGVDDNDDDYVSLDDEFTVEKVKPRGKKRVSYREEDEFDEEKEDLVVKTRGKKRFFNREEDEIVKPRGKKRVSYREEDNDDDDEFKDEKLNIVVKPKGKKRVCYGDDDDYNVMDDLSDEDKSEAESYTEEEADDDDHHADDHVDVDYSGADEVFDDEKVVLEVKSRGKYGVDHDDHDGNDEHDDDDDCNGNDDEMVKPVNLRGKRRFLFRVEDEDDDDLNGEDDEDDDEMVIPAVNLRGKRRFLSRVVNDDDDDDFNGVDDEMVNSVVNPTVEDDDDYNDDAHDDDFDAVKENLVVNPRRKRRILNRVSDDDDDDDDDYNGDDDDEFEEEKVNIIMNREEQNEFYDEETVNNVANSRNKKEISYREQDDDDVTDDDKDDDYNAMDDHDAMDDNDDDEDFTLFEIEDVDEEDELLMIENKKLRKPHALGKAVGKKNSKGRRGKIVHSDSDFAISESSDHEFTISEEERETVKEANKFCKTLTITNFEETIVKTPKKQKGKQKIEDLNIEKPSKQVCGICLTEETKRKIRGTLNCCSHYFCFACILEWSKVESRCPLCKQRFSTISKPSRSDSRAIMTHIPERDQVYQPSEEELMGFLDPYDFVICTECHHGGDDALMLLCDLCDSPAHTYCVGLGREVPEGNWYCEGCKPASSPGPEPGPIPLPSSPSIRESFDLNEMYVGPETIHESSEILSSPILEAQIPSPMGSGLVSGSGSGAITVFERRRIQHQINQFRRRQMDEVQMGPSRGFGGQEMMSYFNGGLSDNTTMMMWQNPLTHISQNEPSTSRLNPNMGLRLGPHQQLQPCNSRSSIGSDGNGPSYPFSEATVPSRRVQEDLRTQGFNHMRC